MGVGCMPDAFWSSSMQLQHLYLFIIRSKTCTERVSYQRSFVTLTLILTLPLNLTLIVVPVPPEHPLPVATIAHAV